MSQAAHSSLSALSPLDGRYAGRMAALRPLMSEYGLMQRRVQVEVEWFIALSDAGFAEFRPLGEASRGYLRSLVLRFSEADAQQIKDIERITNHDVKAVEYWMKQRFKGHADLEAAGEFVHFACTSEDINNTSHALMLKAAREQVLLPAIDRVITKLHGMAQAFAPLPMLSRTHGQTASPTTVGKEVANVVARLQTARARIAGVALLAKMNGAVGNYNAHLAAYPAHDWPAFSRQVVEQRLGLAFNPYTIQIEPHDYMAELFDAFTRANTLLIDWSRDVWGYISLGYFRQRTAPGEVGSSTMPHKVNPIDFENSEGNLGLANALLGHLADKLPVSRFQRDLSDSTVLRSLGAAAGHCLVAYTSTVKGMGKLQPDAAAMRAELDAHAEVLAEPIQTVMRRYGVAAPYEQLKALTRGRGALSAADMREFVRGTVRPHAAVPAGAADALEALTPATYLGYAERLARSVKSRLV